MFGDILTDETSVFYGTMGVIPSASISNGNIGLYEPIHGSAPDIANQGIANPIAMILSAAWMLRLSFGLETEATFIEGAVDAALTQGKTTSDLGGQLSTEEVGLWIAQTAGKLIRAQKKSNSKSTQSLNVSNVQSTGITNLKRAMA